MNRIKNTHGAMLIAILISILIIGAIGAGLAALVASGTRSSADHSHSVQAFFLAETGFEQTGAELQESHADGDDWEIFCEDLVNDGPRPVEDIGYFEITQSMVSNGAPGCQVTLKGWTGPENSENAFASRRIKGLVPKQVIENKTGGDDNIFDDESNWKGGGANVDFEDGAMILQRPGGHGQGQGGQGNTNTHSNATDLLTEDFTSGETIFFAADISWDALPVNEEFIIELQMQENQADIECTVQFPSLNSGCSEDSQSPLYEQYSLVLELGDDINAADIDQIKVRVDWGNGDTEEVILENGCIGTEQHCLGGGDPQDPVEDGTWQEE